MIDPFEPPHESPPLESTSGPQTGRVGGRRSAVIGAVAVIGVLVAMVWVGLSGRSTPPVPPPAVALQPSVASTAGEPTTQPSPFVQGETDGPTSLVAEDVFGAFATFGNNRYITILNEPEPGHLFGRISLPLPIEQSDGTFSFQQFSSPQARGRPMRIATWPINVETVAADSPLVIVVDESFAARRTLLNAPRPLLRGFHLTVTAQRAGSVGELTIDIRIGPNQRILGDDGIFGWPVVALLPTKPTSYPVGDVPDIHRPDGGNQCRWYQPTPGTDEADCLAVPY